MHRRHALHITVVLSKTDHSGPCVCLRARSPCPLRVSCPEADRALCRNPTVQSVQCELQSLRFRGPLGTRQVLRPTITSRTEPDDHTLRFLTPFHTYTSLRTVQTHLCLCAKYCGVSTLLSTDRTDTYVKNGHPPEKKIRFWEDDDDDQEKSILGGHARNRTITRCASLPRSTHTLLCGPYRHICDCARSTGVFERTCLQTEQIHV